MKENEKGRMMEKEFKMEPEKEIFQKRKDLICELIQDELYVPMKEKEMAAFMQVAKEDRRELRRALEELHREGKISVTAKGKYVKPDADLFTGTFISNARGFGFVEVEGRETDLFIPETAVNGAFHHDTVQVKLLAGQKGKRQEAEVVRIIERGMTQVVGTYQKSKNYGFVIPDDAKVGADIFVASERSGGAADGHKVVVELADYGDGRKNPEGKVVEILGPPPPPPS